MLSPFRDTCFKRHVKFHMKSAATYEDIYAKESEVMACAKVKLLTQIGVF